MAIQYFWRHPLAEQVREEGREEGLQQGLEQGRIQKQQEMTLRVLEWRGIPVPDAVRERVLACEDLDRLELWAQRAVHATDAAELFAGE
jgi:flagellar biosynthesis/type III secretory pathway protein FliH